MDNDRSTVASSSSSSSGGGSHHDSSARNSRGGGPNGGMATSSSQGPPPPPSSQSSQMRTKNITFGELTDKIISNDYHNHPMHLRAPPPHPTNFMSYMQDPQGGIIATDLFRRRVQKEEAAAAASKGGPPSTQQTINSNSNPGTLNSQGRSTTPGDDRNIIRMPQSLSPRKYMQEFMIAQDYHYQQQQQQQQPGGGVPPPTSIMRGSSSYDANSVAGSTSSGVSTGSGSSGGSVPNHTFDTMKYVQNRIVEVMRTEDDHRVASGGGAPGSGANDHHDHHNDHRMKNPHEPRKTPNQYDDRDSGRRSASSDSSHSHPSNMSGGGGGGSYQPTPVTTFAATTYAYPYSALNVPSSVAALPPTSQMNLNVGLQMPPTSSGGSSMHKQATHVLHGGGAGCSTGVSSGGHDGNPTTSGVGGGSGASQVIAHQPVHQQQNLNLCCRLNMRH